MMETIPAEIGLTVDAALINRLGYELVGKAETAVAELVKNAYDADARKVEVFFRDTDKVGGTIIVKDNGTGMDFEKLKYGFLRISTSDKVVHPKSERYNRARAGRKGIGRFATQRIGNKLVIITTKIGMDYALKVSIDWQAYHPNKDLETILFPVEKVAKNIEEGTELIISEVRDAWADSSIKRVHRYVMELFQPDYLRDSNDGFSRDNTFDTIFLKWENDHFDVLESGQDSFFSKALVTINGKIDDLHQGTISIQSDSLLLDDMIQMDGKYSLLSNVIFKAYYFIYGRPEYYTNGMSATTLREINKMASSTAGIRLYRNGFRVLPYGDPSNDWINLNERWAGNSGVNIPFSTHNIFGYVQLVDYEGQYFDETSSREGLIENEAFSQLKEFLYKAFTMARNRISSSQELRRLKENRVVVDPSEPLPEAIDMIASVRSYVQSKIELADSTDESQQRKVLEILSSLENIMGEMEMLRVLAGLGLSIGSFSHEMEQFKPSLMSDLIHLVKGDMSYKEIVDSLGAHLETLFAYTRFFNIAISENLNREIGTIDLLKVIDDFHNTIENDLLKQQIDYDFVPRAFDLIVGPMHEAELISVLYNLYTNARKAIIKNNQPGAIIITAGVEGRNIYLCFQDNGCGIPAENRSRIFDAFFTTSTPASFDADEKTKLTGSGLGLKIVRDILMTRGGDIFLSEPDNGYNTNFKILLPRAND